MATMKKCIAELSTAGPWGHEHFWPGLVVDLDRELAPAVDAKPEKGTPGTDGYEPEVKARKAFLMRDAIAGRESCFVDIEPDGEALSADAPAAEPPTKAPKAPKAKADPAAPKPAGDGVN